MNKNTVFKKIITFTSHKMDNKDFNIREDRGKKEIFDIIRKKFVALTPEEWVRQNFIRFLTVEKKYPGSLLSVEKEIRVNKLAKRFDIAVFDTSAKPVMIIECKAPEVKISQDVFDQVARYNMFFKVKHLVVTNGNETYCCRIDFESGQYHFLDGLPDYNFL